MNEREGEGERVRGSEGREREEGDMEDIHYKRVGGRDRGNGGGERKMRDMGYRGEGEGRESKGD